MLKKIDAWIDSITMYRLVLYYLIALIIVAVVLCLTGNIQYSPVGVAFSAGYITLVCWVSNKVFAYVFEAPANIESALITALILALIITPYKLPHDLLLMTAASGLAIASKFILAIRKKHIFNPAAIAVVLTAFGAHQSASWWVGNAAMLPFVIIGGMLVVRKIRRFSMLGAYLLAALVSTVVTNLITQGSLGVDLNRTLLHSSLFFLGFVMLTEPLTSPSTRAKQASYGALVGALFPPQVHLLSLYSTPELSLIVGNIFSYIVSPKLKLLPKLKEKLKLSPHVVDFVFATEHPVRYQPGQYMEWTLPHAHSDSRGNRRYLTLASSPTEDNLRVGVKFYADGSSYKKAMLEMNERTPIAAGQLGGNFTLPRNPTRKLAFIAGGIGVTPYRSMLKYLVDSQQRRDITLLYSERTSEDFVYTDVFDEAAQQLGIKITYTLTGSAPSNWPGQTGQISAAMIKAEIPDYAERLFYVSGTHSMVVAVESMLGSLGVPRRQIKTDFFSGYA